MSSEIILNLDLPEYQDEFHSSEENAEQGGLWQQEANRTLISFLKKMGESAKQYKTSHSCINEQDVRLNSYQHAVFISGARGTGKTVFLRNAKSEWEFYTKKKPDAPYLHFIDVIDPTLLNINDRFSEVIIASVYASVDKCLKHPEINQEKKDRFYNALKTLSSALGKSSEFDEYKGIDRIQKYRSGIHIERYFHQFLITSADLLSCDALVLPIDDVDMKIDNAYGVLDDIRCLLSCPLILPLVSGDDDMYRHITTMKFEESLAKNSSASNFEDGKDMAERLSNAYLTKVFPNHARIRLIPISQLLSKLKIKYINNKTLSENHLMYEEYEKLIKKTFYPLCNGKERSTDWPFPDSAREISQFIRLITPTMLNGMDENNETLWRQFAIWAEEKQDGIALTNAESFFTINSMQASDEFNLNNIIAFNPLMQKNYRRWAKKHFYEQQLKCITDLKAHTTNMDILNTVFTKPIKDNATLKENNVLRSFPPLEFNMDPMYLTKGVAEQDSEDTILLALYTYNEYYSKQLNRRYHIFFSRAFEVLAWSLLAITGNIPSELTKKETIKDKFKKIFARVPFYSSFALNSTRIFDEKNEKNDSENDYDDVVDKPIEYSPTIHKIIDDIYLWYEKHSINDFKKQNMVPLLSFVFNKVFSQLNVLRSNISSFPDEHLSDLANRFEFIFINALTSFVRDGMVVNTNVATGAKSSSVRSREKFLQFDRTLARNILGLDLLNSLQPPKTPYAQLIKAMWEHPIFKLTSANPSYPIGSNNIYSIKNLNNTNNIENIFLSNLDEDGIIEYYYQISGNNFVTISSVCDWIKQNTENKRVVSVLYDLIHNDKYLYSLTGGNDYFSRLFKGIARTLGKDE